jgi:membrane associated rhomboid family serine protease
MSDVGQGAKSEPAFNIAPVVLVLIAFMVGIHGFREFIVTPQQDNYIIAYGAFIPLAYQGEVGLPTWSLVTSPVTYAFLHGSWAHVGINSMWLAVFGAPLAARIGASRFLAFFVVTAIAAALLHFALHHDSIAPLIGASGAVSGFTAAAARFGFSTRGNSHLGFTGKRFTLIETFTNRTSLSFIVIWFAINFLPAISNFGGTNIAWEAHIGGFIAGLLLLPLFDSSAHQKR